MTLFKEGKWLAALNAYQKGVNYLAKYNGEPVVAMHDAVAAATEAHTVAKAMELTKKSHPVAETTAPASKLSGADGGAELLPGEALQEEPVQVESSDADAAAEASSRVVVVDLLV